MIWSGIRMKKSRSKTILCWARIRAGKTRCSANCGFYVSTRRSCVWPSPDCDWRAAIPTHHRLDSRDQDRLCVVLCHALAWPRVSASSQRAWFAEKNTVGFISFNGTLISGLAPEELRIVITSPFVASDTEGGVPDCVSRACSQHGADIAVGYHALTHYNSIKALKLRWRGYVD